MRGRYLRFRLRAERNDAGRADAGVVGDHGREAVVAAPEHLLDRALSGEVEAEPAVCLGNGKAEEPDRARLGHQLFGDGVVLLDPARARLDLLLDEAPHFLAQALDFGSQIHEWTGFTRLTGLDQKQGRKGSGLMPESC